MPTAPSYVPNLAHQIVALLDAGDLHAATDLAQPVAAHEHAWRRLNLELAALAAPRPGIVTVGLSSLVWGHPYRSGHSWRCGSCTWTGVNYPTAQAALRAARAHLNECDAAARPELCEIRPYDSLHSRMTTLLHAA